MFAIDGLTLTGGRSGTGGAVVMPSAESTLRVTNTTFATNAASNSGGAVYALGSTEFDHVAFTGNTAKTGGAVYSLDAATFADVTFTGNSSTEAAGAVYQGNGASYTRTTFIDNDAVIAGGAIVAFGVTTISNSKFSGNTSVLVGGGAIAASDAVVVADSEFTKNLSHANGGAIYAGGPASIARSRFTENAVDGIGGAVYAEGATTVVDSMFGDNSSVNDGAALTVHEALAITGSTIMNNTSVNGEGAFWADGVATVVNSTITGNVGGALASTISANDLILSYSSVTEVSVADGQMALVARSNRLSMFASVITGADGLSGGALCNVAATSFGYNFASDSTCGLTSTGDTQDAAPSSAQLGALLDNGGLTLTQLPLITSPLVGAIPDGACTTGPAAAVTADQRGFARPNIVSGTCDIGALQLTPMVSATVTGSTIVIGIREFTSTATVTIHSDPVVLGTIAVDATGSGQATFALPGSVMCGAHEIIATASGGQIASMLIEIGDCAVPIFTG